MGFLDRAISRGISRGVSNAIGDAVQQAIAPKVERVANKMSDEIDKAAASAAEEREAQQRQRASTGMFANLQKSAENYATEMSKNIKICPNCGESSPKEKDFCPHCGTKLPDKTAADGYVCTACGLQNTVGTKFCSGCGEKLPAAVEEEENARLADEKVLGEDWDTYLAPYPKWQNGGSGFDIEQIGEDNGHPMYEFRATGVGRNDLLDYKELLKQNGFARPPGWSSDEELYKVIDGVSYSVNSTEPFPCEPGHLQLCFHVREFKPPEQKKAGGLFGGLFK
ncbi:zinc ribbon domain-containing protein [Methanocorpusculum sp.]|nr:zinc ribbon domain-containing protein [Methanocorpusculum sp.]MBO5367657.1 zinc ribbon domain-containing protein [Methanocorpusculum sp.]MBO5431613.1 zinc ribbon domain-containing protein [Methanocorpusculum sp.]HJJ76321.1 zinc ribbon domain-containing protein [Methanocorpusculum sp.]